MLKVSEPASSWAEINYASFKKLKSRASYESVKRLDGYDCKYESVAQITATYFPGSINSGNIVYSYTVINRYLEREPISSSLQGEKHWKIAYGKN